MKVLLVDEKASDLEHLAHLLESMGCRVVSALGGLSQLSEASFLDMDACFLSPSLMDSPGLNGIRHLPERLPVVLVSESTDLAFAAFEAGVLDYLKKPVKAERLSQCLLRISESSKSPELPRRTRRTARFPAKVGDGVLMIDLGKTTHFTFEDHAVWAHAVGRFHTFWRSLAEVEEAFPGAGLFRAQRHVLVVLDQIVGLRGTEQGRVQVRLQGGIEVDVSRGASPKLKDRLGIP